MTSTVATDTTTDDERDDKPVADCTADQFRPYSREAV